MTNGVYRVTFFPAAEDDQIVFHKLFVVGISRICPPDVSSRKTPGTPG